MHSNFTIVETTRRELAHPAADSTAIDSLTSCKVDERLLSRRLGRLPLGKDEKTIALDIRSAEFQNIEVLCRHCSDEGDRRAMSAEGCGNLLEGVPNHFNDEKNTP